MTLAEVADQIREALIRDGYEEPPAPGWVYRDDSVTWAPEGRAEYVKVESIGKTVTGWQCTIIRWEQITDKPLCPWAERSGAIYLDRLLGPSFVKVWPPEASR